MLDSFEWFRISLRLVPASLPNKPPQSLGENTEFGTHDTFRHGFNVMRANITQGHPLESHLEQWDQTQEQLKTTVLRNTFGIHMPLRLKMEQALIKEHIHVIPVMPSRNLALDVLSGRNDTIEFEDFLGETRAPINDLSPHTAMERVLHL
ncbi:hypothetical protein BATDEDRAFT_91476 [Batrachochytrium dendrobatidis JAM81]|uniref:Proteasome maturation protein n=1 Tax=Batrachochytrium dendrobatidis (strain JAM81 / FGSC 10211) TaxID=684364 RepID=F4PB40_BATDJ|nr:uncharacterized protein BATDEDRAFT_91476 [Batrachochytrium dendrobatidis JAM81]EGF77787.1 hypothetical protein BATDEDRAFT_91476 [Batrachochytrium dendrobatidis JAM81]|eukprot:XP_006681843.1 hypothetical protein BATDEDRAFT_91476 [Batrachochytrium dendrobatidis JAM81]